MNNNRDSYLINRAFRNVLSASLLSSMAFQLAISIGTIIAGHYISSDAISVINLTLPLSTAINATVMLAGIGASYRISRKIGNRDFEGVSSTFSASLTIVILLGLLESILLLSFRLNVAHLLTSDARLLPMLTEYLSVFAICPLFFMLSLFLSTCVKSTGKAKLVTQSTIISGVIKITTDLLLVCVLGIGIKGIAFGLLLYLISQTIMLFWKGVYKDNILRKLTFKFHAGTEFIENSKQAMPLFVSMLVMAVVMFSINNIVASALGTDGMSILSICIQVMMILTMLMTGVNSALLPIGNMLMGENDIEGVRMLNHSTLRMAIGISLAVALTVEIFPSAIMRIFGADATLIDNGGAYAMRILALYVPLLAYSMMRMSTLMILSYQKLASFSAACRTLFLLIVIAVIAKVSPHHLWWGLPLSVLINESIVAIMSYRIHKRTPGTNAISLIPSPNNGVLWSMSVTYTMQSLDKLLDGIREFYKVQKIDSFSQNKMLLVTEELATNIISFASKGKETQRFDVVVHITDKQMITSIKDDGRPFNPIIHKNNQGIESISIDDMLNGNIGLHIVNSMDVHIDYRYMYNQNIVTAVIDFNS